MALIIGEQTAPSTPASAKAEIYLTVGGPGVVTVKHEDGSTVNLEAGAGGGETNTASNKGTGTNIFIQKTTFDLEFNGIKSENSRITIAEDAGSNDVEITLVESAIIISNLSGYVAAEHLNWENSVGTIHTDNYIEGGAGTDTTAIHDNVNSEISTISVKGTPVGADFLLIEDSAASNAKKHMLISGLEAILDHDALTNFLTAEHVDWAGSSAGTIHTDNYIEGGAGTDTTAIHNNTANEISAITVKASPVGGDFILIEDSAASNVKKHILISTLPTGADSDAIHDNVASEISAITNKGTPVAGDFILIEDSAAANVKKHMLISELEAILNHDSLAGFVANEHIDHSGVSITVAGDSGEITVAEGAQTIAASRTFTVGIADAPTIPGDYMTVPTKADPDPTGADGRLFYNTTDNDLRYAQDTTWRTVANLDSTQTLSGKTLTTPTIASFANAAHDHTDAAGGAQITDAALSAAVGVAKGGTGLTAGTDGGLLAYTATGTIASSALLVANAIVMGGGAGVVPATLALGGAFTQLRMNAAGTASEWSLATKSKSITIEDPADGDRLALWMNESAITVLGVSFASLAGTSVLFNLEFQTTIASGTVIHADTCASTTPEWDVTPSGTADVPTDRIILLEITTVTGSVTDFVVTVHYRENV